VCGVPGRALADRLHDAEDPARALRLLLGFLEEMTEGARDVDWRTRCLVRAVEADRCARLSDVAGAMGVSVRSLRQRVSDEVGLSPKRIQRIVRLQAALTRLLRSDAPTGSVVAHWAGYADQAHFIHECRRLLGDTPEAFRARGADSYKPVPCREA
jgi:AraC-like DNA-binding protein